ncbi:hypothetical protein HYV49_05340 [Candidatus Pacearchaeota archaeon]|nr:hypothetical protein [Candidatus Pacearchaeota archaeon]
MPKAILEYNLPEDDYEYKMATGGNSFYVILQEFDNWLKDEQDYGDRGITVSEVRDLIRNKLHELLRDESVDIWRY